MAAQESTKAVRWFGWLDKAGPSIISKWQTRLFVITNDSVEYWEAPSGRDSREEPSAVLNKYFGGNYTAEVLGGRGFLLKGTLRIDELLDATSTTVGKTFHIRVDMGKRVYHCRTQSPHLQQKFISTLQAVRDTRARHLEEMEQEKALAAAEAEAAEEAEAKAAEEAQQQQRQRLEAAAETEAETEAEDVVSRRAQHLLRVDTTATRDGSKQAVPETSRRKATRSPVNSSRIRALSSKGLVLWEGWLLKSGNTADSDDIFDWRYFILRAVAVASGQIQTQLEYWAPPDGFFDSDACAQYTQTSEPRQPLSQLVSKLRFSAKGAIPAARIQAFEWAKGGRSAFCIVTAKNVYRMKAIDRDTIHSLASALTEPSAAAQQPPAAMPPIARRDDDDQQQLMRYRVVAPLGAVVRESMDMQSPFVALVRLGQTVTVYERQVLAEGTVRLRISNGWISEAIAVADEQQAQVETIPIVTTSADDDAQQADEPSEELQDAAVEGWVLKIWPDAIEGSRPTQQTDYFLDCRFGNQVLLSPRCSTAASTAWLPQPELRVKIPQPARLAAGSSPLLLTLFDADRYWDDVLVGAISLDLGQFVPERLLRMEYELSAPDSAAKTGTSIKFSAILLPSDHAHHLRSENVYEYQQLSMEKQWGPMQCDDGAHFINAATGQASSTVTGAVAELEPHFAEMEPWTLLTTRLDPEGWMYAVSRESDEWHREATESTLCRRRVWSRVVKHVDLEI